ncbi:hypothetical protein SpCBS45565_g03157 [Spizellomyces sp. 'palustris']|nr:hypothetical protein SpCBS45565_g03157 [Spizellomyces sp. 'palustris']
MSDASKHPPEIDIYDIILDRQEVVLREDEKAAGPYSKLEGVVRLHLNSPLKGVRALSFRFVAGAVAKWDSPELNANLRGPERLFDRTIYLWDKSDPDAAPYLDAQQHEFRFALKIPGRMPPSLRFPQGQVQYMLVAAIEWEATCFGIPVPFWSWRSIITKKEVPVRKIPGKVESVIRRLKDMSHHDEKKVWILYSGDVNEGNESRSLRRPLDSGRTVWSPIPVIDITLPTRFPLTDPVIPVTVHTVEDAELIELRWTLRQHALYRYMYNMALRGPIDTSTHAIPPKQREEEEVLRTSYVYRAEPSDPLNQPASNRHELRIPLLDDPPASEIEALEDLDTSVMKFQHVVHIHIIYRSNSDIDGERSEEEAEIDLPIILYNPPSEDDTIGI